MKTSMDLCVCLLTLCVITLGLTGPGVKVVVKEGSDAVLPCSLNTKEDITGKVSFWKKDGHQEVFFYDSGIHHNNGLTGQDEQFKGRVSHFQDQLMNGNASIKIQNTKMADSGTYSCDFPYLQPRQTFNIELVVEPIFKDRSREIPGKPDIIGWLGGGIIGAVVLAAVLAVLVVTKRITVICNRGYGLGEKPSDDDLKKPLSLVPRTDDTDSVVSDSHPLKMPPPDDPFMSDDTDSVVSDYLVVNRRNDSSDSHPLKKPPPDDPETDSPDYLVVNRRNDSSDSHPRKKPPPDDPETDSPGVL